MLNKKKSNLIINSIKNANDLLFYSITLLFFRTKSDSRRIDPSTLQTESNIPKEDNRKIHTKIEVSTFHFHIKFHFIDKHNHNSSLMHFMPVYVF